MKQKTFQRGFLLLLVAFVTAGFVWMIQSFLITLLFAAIFSSLARPLYLRVLSFVGARTHAASSLTLLILVVAIILPLFGFVGIVASQAAKVTEAVTPWVKENLTDREELNQRLKNLPGYKYVAPHTDRIREKIGAMVSGLGNFIFQRASAFTAGTIVFFLNLGIMLYAMFFFFVDGPAMLEKILYYMPLGPQEEKKLLGRFRSMAQATIKGLVVIGVVQGALAGVALWAAGIGSSLFWGTVMAVLSIIPNIGSALVWVPACIFLYIKGNTVAAALVFLWCVLIVGTADNFLRPILVGKGSHVPEFLILVSTLGGLAAFGLAGFVLGPVLAVLFLTVWEIYGTKFQDILP